MSGSRGMPYRVTESPVFKFGMLEVTRQPHSTIVTRDGKADLSWLSARIPSYSNVDGLFPFLAGTERRVRTWSGLDPAKCGGFRIVQ